jgi:hypothetical protein
MNIVELVSFDIAAPRDLKSIGQEHRVDREALYVSRNLAALRISSSEMFERSHMPQKIPSSMSYNLVGVSNSAMRPAAITQILS